jgi:hypothetical protein
MQGGTLFYYAPHSGKRCMCCIKQCATLHEHSLVTFCREQNRILKTLRRPSFPQAFDEILNGDL